MSNQRLIETEIVDNIAVVTINRQAEYNSFDDHTLKAFADTMISLALNSDVKAVIITGKGKSFSGGGDLKTAAGSKGGVASTFYNIAHFLHLGILEIRKMPKPVIAAINGTAAGGGFSLALACDFRFIATSSKMKQAYTSNGLSIDGGGSFTLPKLVGHAKAIEIAFLDEIITPEKALEIGLVNSVVPDDKLLDFAINFAKKYKNVSLNSFGVTKKLFNESFSNSLEKQLELEREWIAISAQSEDGKEGVKAFLEKRKPNYFKLK
jgi:2-(1,2-epoxy-1,2-dihydrophenyl)acetyl-CoA isomerase